MVSFLQDQLAVFGGYGIPTGPTQPGATEATDFNNTDDLDTLLLPDQITLPLLWLGILAAVTVDGGPSPAAAVFGAIGGYLLFWLFYWGHRLLTRREGMGYGDFKLLAALGAWLGWRAILPVVLIASILGILYAAIGLFRRQADRSTPIPFGTFLCIGGATILFAHETMLSP